MIPYDELVIALQAWRAKKGLPIGQMSGSLVPPAPAPVSHASSPGSGPGRVAPPAPPPRTPARTASQLPTDEVEPATESLAHLDADEHEPVAEAELEEHIEEHQVQHEGDEFAAAFHNLEQDGESTSIGSPPPPTARDTRNDDW